MIFDTRRNPRTEERLQRAVRELSRADPTLARLIRQVGPCQLGMTRRNHYFPALVETIIYQQLGGKAAAAILGRFRSLYPSLRLRSGQARRFPTAAEVYNTPNQRLRAAGLSQQKITYLKELSGRVLDGSFPLRRVSAMEDEEVIRHLTQVKGIGRWTAEMFLIFTLGRADILPLNDLGIRKAAQNVYGLKTLPSARTLERMGRKWKPYRSIASWYLWASVDGGGF